MEKECVLVAASLPAGESLFRLLAYRKVPFAVLVNQKEQKEKLLKLGIERIVEVDTQNPASWSAPDFSICRVFLFEDSLNLTCRYLQIIKQWTDAPVYVVTGSCKPRTLYKSLGAERVVHCPNGDLSSLGIKTYQSVSV
ncbi:hypothetical protein [Gorillibacterium massiliense]|uniref:hypothetical protein n=1 Tax=Gorillibacterium massiliense TaxID=1280390 RepID=UPI0004B6C093|nr:hypothetical protein [Gorillibacterium massiliense]